jgi:hypothetical protein
MVMEGLLFTASLLLHVSVLLGERAIYAEYGFILFRCTVVVGIPVVPFIKDGLRWIDQIKSCPKWMWKLVLSLWAYALLIAVFEVIFGQGASFSDRAWSVSGLPFGFDVLCFCVLYSVLVSGYLEKSEIIRRTWTSVGWAFFEGAVLFGYHIGFLHYPTH